MAAGIYNFVIHQGTTFHRRIQYMDSTGSPIDLTGYGARMQIRQTVDSNIILVNLTTTIGVDGTGLLINETSGTIDITISAISSSLLSFTGDSVYDLEIYSGSGENQYVSRILQGKARLSREVTR